MTFGWVFKQGPQIRDVRGGWNAIQMTRCRGQQIIKYQDLFGLFSQRHEKWKRSLVDTEYKSGKDIVGVSYGQGGEVLAALVAIGQSERAGFATTGALLHFVFRLLMKLFQCTGG